MELFSIRIQRTFQLVSTVLSGYERGQGRENHLGKNMDGTRRRIRAVFPQLVDTGSAAAG